MSAKKATGSEIRTRHSVKKLEHLSEQSHDDNTSVVSTIKNKNLEDIIRDQHSSDIVSYEAGTSKMFQGIPAEWH